MDWTEEERRKEGRKGRKRRKEGRNISGGQWASMEHIKYLPHKGCTRSACSILVRTDL